MAVKSGTMRQIFRLSGRKRFSFLICLLLVSLFPLVVWLGEKRFPGSVTDQPGAFVLTVVLILACIGYLALDVAFTRLVATDDGIDGYDLLNRTKFSLRYEDIVAYRPTKSGSWSLLSEVKEYRLPEIEFQDLHRLMVTQAPRALQAKRWKCGQMPPTEDFEEISLFDASAWFSGILGTTIMAIPLYVLFHGAVIGFVGASLFPRFYDLGGLFGTLSLTAREMTLKWPRRTRRIAWGETTAVFCENRLGRRQFTLIGAGTSIVVPPHIAQDLETMRKFFYSLPDDVLCVNFDQNFRTGYRRRRRRGIAQTAPMGEGTLEPQFGLVVS